MEPFLIACTTCNRRLKIRDAASIGQILICPNCGSMVLVEAPAGSVDGRPRSPVGEGPADAETRWDLPLPDAAEPAEAPPVQQPPVEGARGAAAISDTPPPRPADETPPPACAPPRTPRAEQTPAEMPHPFSTGEAAADLEAANDAAARSTTLLPPDAWTSPATERRRQWLMVGASALLGILLSIALLGLLVVWTGKRSAAPSPSAASGTTAVDPVPSENEGANGASADRADAATMAAGDGNAGETPGAAGETIEEGTEQDASAGTLPPASPAAEPPGSVAAAHAANDPLAVDPAVMVPASPQEAPPEATAAQPASAGDPGVTPQTDAPPDGTDVTAAKPAGNVLPPGDVLPNPFDLFAPLFEPAAVPQGASPETGEVPAMAAEIAAPADEAGAVPRPEPRNIDLAQRLQDGILRVQFEDVPLSKVLRFVSDFSTIPITVDPDALRLVRVSPSTPVRAALENTTVAGLLEHVLSPLQLGFVPVERQLLVTRPPLADGQLRAFAMPVEDLTGGDPGKISQLAGWITELVQPGTWQGGGGEGSIEESPPNLVIRQRDTVLYQCIAFCERLRVARQLPPRSAFPAGTFDLVPAWQRADRALAQPVRLTFATPARLVEILDRLERETGALLLVDWLALAQSGWTPDAETTLTADSLPLRDVLAALLSPLDLTYRVVDRDTLQITTPAGIREAVEIEFYALPGPPAGEVSADERLGPLVERVGKEAFEAAGGAVHWDDVSSHAIIALPQSLQRQLASVLPPANL